MSKLIVAICGHSLGMDGLIAITHIPLGLVPAPMSLANILNEVEQFVPELERTQVESARVYAAKLKALRTADTASLKKLTPIESAAAERLRAHLLRRQQILQSAKQAGLPSESIATLVAAVAKQSKLPRYVELLERIRRTEKNSDKLRQECWIQWIVCNRAISHTGEVLELITHAGQKAPTYGGGLMKEPTPGGTLLDASI